MFVSLWSKTVYHHVATAKAIRIKIRIEIAARAFECRSGIKTVAGCP
jgi:hypothetical protein